jgi:hypothetical protein
MVIEGGRREVIRAFNVDGILFHIGTQLNVLINSPSMDAYGCEFDKYHEDMHTLQYRGGSNTRGGK